MIRGVSYDVLANWQVLVSKQLQKNAENGRRPDKIPQPSSMLEKKSISQPVNRPQHS
ncbi:hypothetical protein BDQ94DRAFT_136326 [Aspergillus welwitschiae]|uniref:Uncharacterized protein n=1 Tax=Aspergillus welwitschiae TaxID=1341132 RepID=A0A3F3QDQ3_9EURO|nr:hypothetical protein BDQ94DRAFT_136326 [Aspergillus welwitschiae]RDH37381.1 hypothetical protein BDQ94DRAFT_136326 [Aspergillus welwitschiae]